MNWSWEHNTLSKCCVLWIACTWVTRGCTETPPAHRAVLCSVPVLGTGAPYKYHEHWEHLGDREAVPYRCLLKWLFHLTAWSYKKKLQITNLQPGNLCMSRTAATSALSQHLLPHINRCSLTNSPARLVWGSWQVITSTVYNERIKSSGNSP